MIARPMPDELADLQAKAENASPNEQPYIYAELVHSMTEIATEQFQAGNEQQASASLRAAQSYAGKIHMNLLRDARKAQERRNPHPPYRLSPARS